MDANLCLLFSRQSLCFNPRARDGRERLINDTDCKHTVSIHAPVMDANTWNTNAGG